MVSRPSKRRRARKTSSRKPASRTSAGPGARTLEYKVVELSHVDESALERSVNQWAQAGWTFDGVQFAMRDSSKRPSMAFLFFTRPGVPLVESEPEPEPEPAAFRSPEAARAHLERLVRDEPNPVTTTVHDAWARLQQLAGDLEGGDA
jgi:hypothetical protein